MTVLGIDPGTERMGYGVLSYVIGKRTNPNALFDCLEYGIFRTLKTEMPGERLAAIEKNLNKIIANYKPEAIGIERLFFTKNQKTVMAVSEARGVVLLSAAKHNIPVFEFTPPQMKLAITGYGKAEKKQVQRMIKEILALKEIPKPDDAADALGMAIACGLSVHNLLFKG